METGYNCTYNNCQVSHLHCQNFLFVQLFIVQFQGADMYDRTHMRGNVKQRDGWQNTQMAVSNKDAHGRKLTD